ncbi:cerebellin-3-like isoform X2 [Pomacea canaliculata]|uniref:cerebellin-3-like isoform X2 n=1 Tax=Pomacea canaliculata TaxID=400727 RepID=UPI000D73CAAC|nr:cerebellin-3-like isoform X2 [Pomacea canaliculata]XP_025091122.1 cerebellin-3-like isoform X2 [Pomacea canaliculata]
MAVALLILMVAMAPTVDSFIKHFPVGVSQLQSQINTLNSKIALLDQRVFFTATLHSHLLTVGAGPLVFNHVLMNTGGGYSPTTGVFTAPCRGLYVFLVQMFTRGNGHANWDLYVNGHMVLRGESRTHDNASNEYMYPVTLQAGDRVWVYSRNSVYIYGTNHSFFGGWLIKAL